MNQGVEDKYKDIIDMVGFEPKFHKRMDVCNRASQFAPFAALSTHENEQ